MKGTIKIDYPCHKGVYDLMTAASFIGAAVEAIGLGFHIDTRFEDYGLFTEIEAERYEALLTQAYDVLSSLGKDPYGVALDAQRKLLPDPSPVSVS